MIKPDVKLIAVVGPTASGKTALALDLAEVINGEIVCADSRTIYKDLDIGTAKPNAEERARVQHHLLDVIEPNESLSAGEFKKLADEAINGIWERGRVPLLVGGSGLYLDAVLYEYDFPQAADPELRAKLDGMGDAELCELLLSVDPDAARSVDMANRRRVVRAIETAGQPRSRRETIRPNTLVIGINMDKEIIKQRIVNRVQMMVDSGFLDEVRRIGEVYGTDCEAFNVIGYRALKDVVFGNKLLEEGMADFVRGDCMLLKKQLTWFKRNPEIHWVTGEDEAEILAGRFLTV